MSPLALALTLGAAFLHASWNLLLRRARDTESSTAVMLCIGVAVFLPLALATWELEPAVWPYLVATWVLELAYFAVLAAAYRRAELSLVYPLARGLAPVPVLAIGVLALGVVPTALEGLGVLLVGVGVVLVRGLRGGEPASALLAMSAGVAIAGYTLVDRAGLHYAAPITYLELALVVPGLLYLAYALVARGPREVRAQLNPSAVAAGIMMVGAYGLVLLALRIAPAASVAAVRESGVVMATAMAAWLLHERVTRGRFAGAALVVAGVAALALG
ncbi:MAG: EamA family transporter [Candidatus Limnocylindrales bacterium]